MWITPHNSLFVLVLCSSLFLDHKTPVFELVVVMFVHTHQAVVALRQHNGLLQAAQDNLPQILQDPLQHRLLTDVSEDAKAGSHTNIEAVS